MYLLRNPQINMMLMFNNILTTNFQQIKGCLGPNLLGRSIWTCCIILDQIDQDDSVFLRQVIQSTT